MIVTVSFPIRNEIYITEPWPIRLGSKTYLIRTEDGKAKAISVRFSGVSPEAAPKLERLQDGPVKANITVSSGIYVLLAEHDVRAWEAMLAGCIVIDIDFDNPTTDFTPEPSDDAKGPQIHSFMRGKAERRRRGMEEFAIYGRAFLAIETGMPLIEEMSLYREAQKALTAERAIDAYNGFFLYIETLFCRGRTGTHEVTNQLLHNSDFMAALDSVVNDAMKNTDLRNVRFKSLEKWADEPAHLIREIVELRGRLRHHSLSSPYRWDPNRQRDYDREARFLALVAYHIAFPRTSGKLWEPPFLEAFLHLAQERHMTIIIHVRLTVRENERTEDVPLEMTFPQRNVDAQLAQAVLSKSLEILNERSPGADLFAIRAWVKSNGTEILRYDVGPTLPR